jgi:hypothetical protein
MARETADPQSVEETARRQFEKAGHSRWLQPIELSTHPDKL